MLLLELATFLQVEVDFLETLCRSASWQYRQYAIGKRDGGSRVIEQPSRCLKAVQRALHQLVIQHLPVHDAAYAYVKGRGIVTHAQQHAGQHYLLRLDIRKFFHSISSTDIRRYLAAQSAHLPAWWNIEDAALFARIVCRHGRLPMGAITSPALSNAMMHGIDAALAALAAARKLRYTRYADDLYFSTDTPQVLYDIPHDVARLLRKAHTPQHLYLNFDKTLHLSRKRGRHITGLVVSDHNRVGLGRQRKREIRAKVHQWPHANMVERQHLQGLLAFAHDVEPDYLQALQRKYGAERMAQVAAMAKPATTIDPTLSGPQTGSTAMKIKDVMHRPVTSCQTGDNLEQAAKLMWQSDCGAIPVTDRSDHPIGILTDRDITLAAARQHKPLWELKATDVIQQRPLYTCTADTELHDALHLMAEKQVRRLPVIDASGRLQGIVAMSDIVHEITRQAGTEATPQRELREAVSTFNAVTTPSSSGSAPFAKM
ncbi:MAG: retron St85 family RNA-directed DNA polymerase [Pseudomonadota bacterium]